MQFSELNLKSELLNGLQKMGITEPTPVQAQSIPVLLQGKDLMCRSKTGSGKTLAFLLPIMEKLDAQSRDVQAIILAPTRELAVQIEREIRKLNSHAKSVTLYGGVSINPQIEALNKWAQIVVGTPGRVLDHLERQTLDLGTVKWAVLDECDRMLDMGFIDDVRNILNQCGKERQTLLFSATMPDEVARIANDYLNNPEKLILEKDEITVNKIRQKVFGVDRKEKLNLMVKYLKDSKVKKGIIFVNTKSWAETLGSLLFRRGFRCWAVHSGLSQAKRLKIIDDFKKDKFPILIATDVAARGLHIDDVTHVVNYDLPRNPKDYIHRIGRTGRAGEDGDAVSFMTQMDQPLLRGIEAEIKMYLDVEALGANAPQYAAATSNTDGTPKAEGVVTTSYGSGSGWDRWD